LAGIAIDRREQASAVLEIDVAGIVANWRYLARQVAPAECAAVVKADGYGLGAVPIARALALAGCRQFFVATLEEALALRQAIPGKSKIAVLHGPPPRAGAEFAEHGLVPVLNDPGQIADWERIAAARGGLPAILHLDTGMARLGLTFREFDSWVDKLRQSAAIRWRALLSHLACADEPGHPLNLEQRTRFAAMRLRMPETRASLAASSGIFLGREYHFDFVRPGAALYGVNPQPARSNPMRQIVRLKARILQIREVDRGQSVGYGATHRMAAGGRLATVAVGYADGWMRALAGRGCGHIEGVRVPLIGRVSMDLAVFDVSGVDPSVAVPDRSIELINTNYGVDAIAADAGTIGYEILTALGKRYHRLYHDAEILAEAC
jgi:alanine racemase